MDFKTIEKKWQDKWANADIFATNKENKKEKHYVLEMFPYPSSSGLHMGHALNYSIGDIFARFKRMKGYNVLYTMGFDSFGLPAENAAIKAKAHPKTFTQDAITNYIKQMKMLGLSYDWSRMIKTHEPNYYQWDQWIFLKLFQEGLAYKKEAPVNWCEKCNTVLANEQVHNGTCWRHEDTPVQVKHLNQWFLKTTAYAKELNNFDSLTHWPETIKKLQKNWIGESFGSEITFTINNKPWTIFTTRPDTLFGVTFMVVSAQHSKLHELVTVEQQEAVKAFTQKLTSVSEEDIDTTEKEGVFTGSYAQHPLTQEKIPVYAGNFVLAEYGSGMVMAVPAHDQRDFEFAKKYNIPITIVIKSTNETPSAHELTQAYTQPGITINSQEFSNLSSQEAKEKITMHLQSKQLGKQTVQYRLRDWLISRQRFWGTPIPIIYCNQCGPVAVPESDLPVRLPDDVIFTNNENPLKTHQSFLHTTCPTCKQAAKRETDTMDTFVNSSWYYLRYISPQFKDALVDKNDAAYWAPIDTYIGGKEHACMHLIYIRFYTKFLRDLGLLSFDEPVVRLFNQGMLRGPDGEKMSKSKGNVVLPETVSEKYGIDAARLFLVSVASPDKDIDWSDEGAQGSLRFIKRVDEYIQKAKLTTTSDFVTSIIHRTIQEVTTDIEQFNYNLAIRELRELFSSFEEHIAKEDLESFVKLLAPFCPHMAEEWWEQLGNKEFVCSQSWPKADSTKINLEAEIMGNFAKPLLKDIQTVLELAKITQPKKISIISSLQWKYTLFDMLKKELSKTRDPGEILKNIMMTELKKYGQEITKIVPSVLKDESKLPKVIISQDKELSAIKSSQATIAQAYNCEVMVCVAEDSSHPKAKQASPGKPAIIVE